MKQRLAYFDNFVLFLSVVFVYVIRKTQYLKFLIGE